MAKPEWGTKRTCQSCGTRFYDLGRSPAVCPACGATFDIETLTRARRPRPPVRAASASAAVDEEEEGVTEEAELADAETEDLEEEEAGGLEEAAEAEDAAEDEEDDEGLIEDASELGEDEDVSDVIEGDIDEEPR